MSGRTVATCVALCLGVTGVSGCGDETSSVTSSQQGTTSEESPNRDARPGGAQVQAFRDCLRENGVELPEPGSGPPQGGGGPPFDRQDPDIQAAFQACRDELPEGAGRPGGRRPPGGGVPPFGPDGGESQAN